MSEKERDVHKLWQSLERRAESAGIDTRTESQKLKGSIISGICRDCTSSIIVKNKRHNEPLVFCSGIGHSEASVVVPHDIEYCSSYHSRNEVDLYAMAQVAWVVDPWGTGKVGFKVETGDLEVTKEEVDSE